MVTSRSIKCLGRFVFFPVFLVFLVLILPFFRLWRAVATWKKRNGPITVAFFHPFCNAGGGGERVLWTSIRSLQSEYGDVIKCVIYTGDQNVTAKQILGLTKSRFNIEIEDPVEFVFLKGRHWVEDHNYPFLTLIGQSLGSLVLAFEALVAFTPDIYFDSMGYAFSFPLFKFWGGSVVGCYVHYPTISTDMLQLVKNREGTYNNQDSISRSSLFSSLKLWYYQLFAALYGVVGSTASVVMVNSSWTQGHVKSLWKDPRIVKVYPPCDTEAFRSFPLEQRQNMVVSVAQFRPEKNHKLQLQALATLFKQHPEHKGKLTLALVGSSRNADDERRIQELRQLAKTLDIEDSVKFVVNASFETLKEYLATGLIGIHTMWNEHFGIGVVEYMAAGLIPLAHNSAGPKMDIVTVGYLAQTEEEFAKNLAEILNLDPKARVAIQKAAREAVQGRFSEAKFTGAFVAAFAGLLLPFTTKVD